MSIGFQHLKLHSLIFPPHGSVYESFFEHVENYDIMIAIGGDVSFCKLLILSTTD